MEKYIFCNYDRYAKGLLRWLDPFHSSVDQRSKHSDNLNFCSSRKITEQKKVEVSKFRTGEQTSENAHPWGRTILGI